MLDFTAHGIGLVSHEAPRLTATGPVPYAPYDADRPLESGMVISIETALLHPARGYIKLEDTLLVSEVGGRHLAIAHANGIREAHRDLCRVCADEADRL